MNYTFKQLIEKSLKITDSSYSLLCDFHITVNGKTWHAYDSSVSHRDILLYCDQGTVTYLVDSYGETNVAELFTWEENQESAVQS